MPLFRSLRSKSSLKSSSASVLSDKDSDFGPRSPSQTTYGSVKAKNYNSVGRTSHKHALSSGGGEVPKHPDLANSQSFASLANNPTSGGGLTSTMSSTNDVAGNAAANKPRPSELFAGKGVQWDSVKLAGPGATPATQTSNTANNAEELQNFLKQRRQWKPTFVTEESTPRESAPTDLNKLSFMSPDVGLQSQGLMSFEDLDKSHQRKQKLLGDNPLGTSIWDEAETSKAGQRRAAAKGTGQSSFAVPGDVPKRRAGSGSVTRKVVPNIKATTETGSTDAMPTAPSRSTSAKFAPQDLAASASASAAAANSKKATNGATTAEKANAPPDIHTLPPPVEASLGRASEADPSNVNPAELQASTPLIRQSADMSSGFVTADNSRPQSVRSTAVAGNGEAPHISPPLEKADLPSTVPEEPATPRAPKSLVDAKNLSVDENATPTKLAE